MNTQVRLLGILFILYHGLSLVLLTVAGFAIGVIGLLSGESDGLITGGAIASAVIIWGIVTALPGIIAGLGLLNFRPWARILAIIVAVLNIWSIPFGTALAIYALYVLVNGRSDRVFSRRYDYYYG